MKFSVATVVAAIAASSFTDVAAFGVQSNVVNRQQSTFGVRAPALQMSLSDLESKLLAPPEPAKNAKPAKKEAPKREVKKAEPKPAPVKKEAPKKAAPAPKAKTAAPVAPAPVAPAPAAPAPKVERKKVERKKVEPKAVAPKAAAEKDPNAGTVGIALGAAPLLVGPLVALSAARSALSKTQARRAEIQKDIEEKEAARQAKAVADVDVDGGGVIGALVSGYDCNLLFGTVICIC